MCREAKRDAHSGQTLMEIIVGIAVAVLITGTAVTAVVLTVRANQKSAGTQIASSLAQEMVDDVRSIAEGKWQDVYGLSDKTASSTYYLTGTSTLAVITGTEDIWFANATYTRWFSVENVNRDDCGRRDISTSTSDPSCTDSSSILEDPSTQKITGYAQWQFFGDTAEVKIVEYITRWSRDRTTRYSDWSGSSGMEGPATEPDANFSTSTDIVTSTPGQISL